MSDRHIIKLTDVKLITCVLQNGLAEDVLEAAKNVGVQGATVSYARGTGIRDRMGLMGVVIDEQKEVICDAYILPITAVRSLPCTRSATEDRSAVKKTCTAAPVMGRQMRKTVTVGWATWISRPTVWMSAQSSRHGRRPKRSHSPPHVGCGHAAR